MYIYFWILCLPIQTQWAKKDILLRSHSMQSLAGFELFNSVQKPKVFQHYKFQKCLTSVSGPLQCKNSLVFSMTSLWFGALFTTWKMKSYVSVPLLQSSKGLECRYRWIFDTLLLLLGSFWFLAANVWKGCLSCLHLHHPVDCKTEKYLQVCCKNISPQLLPF